MLMPDDFKAYSKIRVDNHYFNKENMPSHFKVKEYCPLVFRNLRERFRINETDYINSLTKSQPVPNDPSNKNNTKLYVSHDKMFVIKVLQKEEVEFMHSLLKQYHPYIVEKHGKTLLPQYLGLYRLTADGADTYCVVMKNIFSSTLKIHCKYDLKGMTLDREASVKEKIKDLPTLKDGDFIQDGCKLHVGMDQKDKLIATLTSDVEFLQRFHLTEYSVCVGIHDCQQAEEEEEKRDRSDDNDDYEDEGSEDSTNAVPTPPESPRIISILVKKDPPPPIDPYAVRSSEDYSRREIYFIALVDILCHGTKKRTATITSTQAEQYAKRLVDFMSNAML
ncbi:phosphatidylinositol 5-phosphate 4-kinase type-2 alpha [Caerostris extrusa]|nr:phosphatidylinositol 5-phosphate 4-kinase type-2 alpha [Caerostris extrusa]